jgi:HEPN domain-containing protein
VEKSLKGFLCWHGRTFRKTHNLVELGQSCAQIDGNLELLLRRAAPLTEYAWKFRYPGDYEEPTHEEAKEALDFARQIHSAIVARLPDAVHP